MADTKISDLPALVGSVADADVLPLVDASASETKKISAKHLLESSFALVADGSIPGSKVDGNLPAGSIDTAELADKSVTAVKLADDSSAIYGTVPATGEFRGQIALDSTTKVLSVWSGSAWATAFGVTSVEATGLSPILAGGQITVDGKLELAVAIEDSSGPRQFLAGPTATAGNVVSRAIVGGDLPPATSASLGAVQAGSGLAVSGTGSLSIDNVVAATTDSHIVSYDANGLVTGGRKIAGTDLPVATELNPGVVSPGRGLSMGVSGALNITNQVAPGTGTKFTCDAQGNITDILVLTGSDIPEITADKIVGGELTEAVIGDKTITRPKLADYSISYIQEAEPSTVNPGHIGVLWYQESTAQLRMYNGNSWMPVGFGRLSADNLRWGGLVNADTGKITGVTAAGTTAGLAIGDVVPDATDSLGGLYLLVGEPGNGILVTPGENYDAGDWCLCVNAQDGWIRIDTLSGGGGGGASRLNDLLDVTISAAAEGQLLEYQSNGQWQNVSVVDGGQF